MHISTNPVIPMHKIIISQTSPGTSLHIAHSIMRCPGISQHAFPRGCEKKIAWLTFYNIYSYVQSARGKLIRNTCSFHILLPISSALAANLIGSCSTSEYRVKDAAYADAEEQQWVILPANLTHFSRRVAKRLRRLMRYKPPFDPFFPSSLYISVLFLWMLS